MDDQTLRVINVVRDNLLYVGSGTVDDLLNAGIRQLEPMLVSNLNEAFGETRVTELVEALKKLPSQNYPVTTDLAIIGERWLSRVQPGKSMRKAPCCAEDTDDTAGARSLDATRPKPTGERPGLRLMG